MVDAIYGGVELGGTKTVVGVGTGHGRILALQSIPTEAPLATLAEAARLLRDWAGEMAPLSGVGIAAFGPVDLARGRMLATPKPGWADADLTGAFAGLGCPMRMTTDVGAAGLAEARLGAARGLAVAIYLTVGTGIGGALQVDGRPIAGLMHPEMGHVPVRRQAGDDFPGTCPFHRDCLEGMASGPAIRARFGQPLSGFSAGGAEQALVADYLGQGLATFVLTASPLRIVMGGGVMKTPGLHTAAAEAMRRHLAGYVPVPALFAPEFVVPPALGDHAGLTGALLLAAGD